MQNSINLVLRNFRKDDEETVIEFHERVLRETGAFAPGPWNDDMKNIEEVYIQTGGCFVLIEEENTIVAMGALKIISASEAEIKRMRVEPSLQRQGLGQKVLDYLLLHAKKSGVKRIILDTSEVQKSAQAFYAKNGFAAYGKAVWNGLEILLYEKWLG